MLDNVVKFINNHYVVIIIAGFWLAMAIYKI